MLGEEDKRPVFFCFQSGHSGPFVPTSLYNRGAACKECFRKVYPDAEFLSIKVDAEHSGEATKIARATRRENHL